jgi:predicted metal-dependent phosphoesterase TrpH
MASKLRVEFHCHTIYSKDSLTPIRDLIAAAKERRIDRLVITDHNTIAGALEAKKLSPDLIVVGEEIMTEEGELLAAFVKEEIPSGLSAIEAIKRLKDQEAFISVSHPFDRLRGGGWSLSDLEKILGQVDAIEVFNARCFPPYFNSRAKTFANQHNMLGTVGSDAHSIYELGRATMLISEYEDTGEFRESLSQAGFEIRRSSLFVRLMSRYAVLHKKFG